VRLGVGHHRALDRAEHRQLNRVSQPQLPRAPRVLAMQRSFSRPREFRGAAFRHKRQKPLKQLTMAGYAARSLQGLSPGRPKAGPLARRDDEI
jgi:hypothetical protein